LLPVVSVTAAPKKAPAKPAAAGKGDAKAGQTAFKAEGCSGCHKTKEYQDGGAIGPDLSGVGKEHTAAQIAAYTRKPKAGSVMPAYKGPQKTLDNLAAYLSNQK
jgi:mono/diheme cytochrome c family protein